MKQKSSVNTDLIKVVFFDARDTLGEVDRPGHLVPYRPSTEQLLSQCSRMGVKLGVITNLPGKLTDEDGKKMVTEAVLGENPDTHEVITIAKYIPLEH